MAAWLSEYLCLSPLRRWVPGVILALLIALLDFEVGVELSFSLFYLAPIAIVAWFGSRREGDLMIATVTLARGWVDWVRISEYSHSIAPIFGAAVRSVFFVIAVAVIIRVRESLQREKQYAKIDYLTGTLNSRAFYEAAEKEADRCMRSGAPLVVGFMDCDDFKIVNDTKGHRAGDDMLRTVAEVITRTLRSMDTVARMGGDEFAFILPEVDEKEAKVTCDRLRNELKRAMAEKGWPVTFSIGAVSFARPDESVDSMLHFADVLMYKAKSSGKDTIRVAAQ